MSPPRPSGRPAGRGGGRPTGRPSGGKGGAGRAGGGGAGGRGAAGKGGASRGAGGGTVGRGAAGKGGRGATGKGGGARGGAARGGPKAAGGYAAGRSGSRGTGAGSSGSRGTGSPRRARETGGTRGTGSGRGVVRGERPTWDRDGAGGGRRPAGASERGRPSAAGRRGPRHEAQGIGGDQVEGRQAVRELLAAGRREVREVWIGEGLDPSPEIDDIERLARRRRTRVLSVPRGRMIAEARTDNPQGVLAHAQPLADTDLDALCRSEGTDGRVPFLLVLDGVTDPQNVGALLRSAECAGVTGVVLPRHRAAHVTPTVTKVAAGAIEHLAFAVVAGIPNALARMAELGVVVVGLDTESPTSVFDMDVDAAGPLALVMGAEHRGLSTLTRRRCTMLAAIPQFGTIPSLNVGAAGAVALFDMARRRSA
ncbi:MAG TPA: 23S rRNA (guanosine(2251)-2'-O)-methyltransferase RlmB [Acidimicrobiales bacterium]|nr:23S rRNA (guanosine(2251)-2'-O)-methyltransferase RlmB [Acidimicrobiales bacterium]